MHIKTVILLGNFFHLVCVMLLICQQRLLFNFFTFFIFFIKNAFFIVFYYWGQRFLHLCNKGCDSYDLARGRKTLETLESNVTKRLEKGRQSLPFVSCHPVDS